MGNYALDAVGRREAQRVAERFAKRGGVRGVSTSPLTRAVQTTAEILKACPDAKLLECTSALEPWHLGMFEGEPSAEAYQQLPAYVMNPEKVVPGVGAASKVPGESLDTFCARFLPYMCKQVRCNPEGYGLVLTCSYRNIMAALAWVAGGAKDDWSVDPEKFLENPPKTEPASLWCVEYENGKWVVEPEDLFSETDSLDDVYLLRHSSTALNGTPISAQGS